jgi:hypothetical protein
MLHYWFTIGRMLAPTLGSQKLVHRKPLERWTAFDVELELAGCDDKWIHHIHRFEQGGDLRALGATRLIPPPDRVAGLFASDRELLETRAPCNPPPPGRIQGGWSRPGTPEPVRPFIRGVLTTRPPPPELPAP